MKIGIDIDGVINDLERYYVNCGTQFNYESNFLCDPDLSCYKLKDIYGWNKETRVKFYQQFSCVLFLCNQYLRPFAPCAINILAKNHEIYLITARPDNLVDFLPLPPNSTTASFTETWLCDNKIHYDHLIFTSADKKGAIKRYKIDMMIEDNPEFLTAAVEQGKLPVFCFHASYNSHIQGENITRVYSWYDILHKFQLFNSPCYSWGV